MAGEGGRDTAARLSPNRVRRFSLRSILYSLVYPGETLSRIDAETRALYYKWNVAAVPEVVIEQRVEN